VLFVTAAELLMSLIAAKREDRLDRKLKSYDRYDIVLIDLCVVTDCVELAPMMPMDRAQASNRLHITSTIAAPSVR
jgi:hypothetical protein